MLFNIMKDVTIELNVSDGIENLAVIDFITRICYYWGAVSETVIDWSIIIP